jgi:hypothetical protein
MSSILARLLAQDLNMRNSSLGGERVGEQLWLPRWGAKRKGL